MIKDTDMHPVGIVDEKLAFVAGEAKAVRLRKIVDQQVKAAVGCDPVNALKVQFLLPFDAIVGKASVCRVGEVDGTATGYDDVVRAVQLFALPMRCLDRRSR